jgi:tagaturonate reductase
VPEKIAIGFAAYLLFMKVVKEDGGIYFGEFDGSYYPVKDDRAAYFFEKWKHGHSTLQLVTTVLKNIELWGSDLSQLPGFTATVAEKIDEIKEHGITAVLQLSANKILV